MMSSQVENHTQCRSFSNPECMSDHLIRMALKEIWKDSLSDIELMMTVHRYDNAHIKQIKEMARVAVIEQAKARVAGIDTQYHGLMCNHCIESLQTSIVLSLNENEQHELNLLRDYKRAAQRLFSRLLAEGVKERFTKKIHKLMS